MRQIVLIVGLPYVLIVGLLTAARVVAQSPPALTDLEQAKVELLQVRTAYAQLLAQYDGCKAEVGTAFNALGRLRAQAATTELSEEEQRLKATVESGHPGFSWNPKTGAFTPKSDPPKAEK